MMAISGGSPAAPQAVFLFGSADLNTTVDSTAAAGREALCFDPQTSGGLLAAVDPAAAEQLLGQGFWRVGVAEAGDARLVLR